jgi:hypothetical protein
VCDLAGDVGETGVSAASEPLLFVFSGSTSPSLEFLFGDLAGGCRAAVVSLVLIDCGARAGLGLVPR